MPKITKRVVDAATPEPNRYIIWDSEIKGFGMLVMPSGIKSYFYQYRTGEGRQRRATIGKHGEWTPTHARAKAEDHREAVRAGRDPLADKRALKEAPASSDTGSRSRAITQRGRRKRNGGWQRVNQLLARKKWTCIASIEGCFFLWRQARPAFGD